jgi:signal transduction histidine kinase
MARERPYAIGVWPLRETAPTTGALFHRYGMGVSNTDQTMNLPVPSADRRLDAANRELEEANDRLRRANEELARRYEKSRQMDALKSRFFSDLSHELRTPLTLILGPVTRRLAADDVSPEERRELETVERNAKLLLRYVTDLLDVGRLEEDSEPLSYAEFDLALLVRLMASQFETVAKERRIRFGVDAPEALTAQADFDRVRRILLGLLSNAFRAVPYGGVISVWLSARAGQAIIGVQDNGPGVAPEVREAVFESPGEAGHRLDPIHAGAGVGLAVVREFAALHGGSAVVDEAPGGGALFTVSLPLSAPAGTQLHVASAPLQGQSDPPADDMLRAALSTRISALPADADRPLVLVVEDNPDMNRFIAVVLGQHYRVATAFDGKEGLDMALAFQPDLILSDVMMPRMSGDRMIRALRKHREVAEVPIIMLTGKADDALRVDLLREGVQDYLNKPFSAEELLARIGARISARRRQEAALKALRAEMEELLKQQVASQTAAAIAHELNQPLSALASYTDAALRMLRAGNPAPEKLQRALEAGATQTQRAGQVVRELLQFLQGREAATEAIDLRDAIDRALAVVESNGLDGFDSTIRLPAQLPRVRANRLQVEKVLVNLVCNGVDAMRAAGVNPPSIVIEVRPTADGNLAQVSVQDCGPGLSEDAVRRVFQPFYTTKPTGIGMGLAISRALVEANGGRLWAEAASGVGGIFHFTLPWAP